MPMLDELSAADRCQVWLRFRRNDLRLGHSAVEPLVDNHCIDAAAIPGLETSDVAAIRSGLDMRVAPARCRYQAPGRRLLGLMG